MAYSSGASKYEGEPFLVRGKSNGESAWFYVLIHKLKLPLYHRAIASGKIDLEKLGSIIHSGFGENPPEGLAEELKRKYS